MAAIVVLGGAGGVGRVAVEALTHIDSVSEVVVADRRRAEAAAVVAELDDPRLTAAAVDVSSPASLSSLISGAAVVLNCVGPFYRFGPPTLRAAIDAGVGYVDICDDLDATRAMLEMDGDARAAGVTALIGMGNSPGLANIFVKLCADGLLDEVTTADICHVHGGEPFEGAAVLKHRIHAMVDDVPLFIDGEQITVRQLDESGAAHVRDVDFAGVGTYPTFPYPHPETVTLPMTFPTLQRATNLGVVYPLSYFQLTQDLVRAGMASEEPVAVGDALVAPIDVMVALLQQQRPRLLAEAGVEEAGGCLHVEVGGIKDGESHSYVFSLTSRGAGAGEGTGIPAALGAALHVRGSFDGHAGVHAPEAIVPVDELLTLAADVVTAMSIGSGDGIPLTVEHVGPDGSAQILPWSFS
ncbi:MAG TPA: saccharopine dehydrogenase NADP-binding domain-containing protein [Microthrixaceae bacterium]|nr:saccharopine dehydrogenase NADP-binding domain-containing protein [Microthrixaceae bacterium]MCB9374344.1 saccharopine dehydrogenase NADP-binding domain-containing protein [Microthrixaceae bacterium]MCB9399936.1 saccharopine dehydrogenase NADP-binding domain-containing protein [Microthrixaceae bacterium]HMX64400.1 saccharopine dehydrogenase NADP-binding domain-containing protein [Microthrixaceae bacterium]HNE75091.1 saccharopine dehydrogenase NADP-binding domain-containing protein [Microthri